MLAARDQENLVHAHQTTAANKPLNQSLRQLAPKTPGNKQTKTPFRLRDENDPLGLPGKGNAGKPFGKSNENITLNTQKKGKATFDPSSFVTPLGE